MLESVEFKDKYYLGITYNLGDRLMRHNNGNNISTKRYTPWKIVYTETYLTKSEAQKREYFLKSPKGYLEKKQIIEKIKSKTGGVA